MDVGEDGTVQISGFNATKMAEVEKYCGELVAEKGGRSGGGGERAKRASLVKKKKIQN